MNRDWLPWIVWLLVFGVALAPLAQRQLLRLRREGGLQRLGRARGSRALALIHHRETYRFLGLPVLRHEEPADAERVLRAAGVDPGTRGEQLTVADFARICAARQDRTR